MRPNATQSKTEGIGLALLAGVTGENSPRPTNQPQKRKTDRACSKKIFGAVSIPLRGAVHSFGKQRQLPRSIRGSLFGNAAKPVDQTLHAVLNGDGRVSVWAGDLLARQALDLELNQ